MQEAPDLLIRLFWRPSSELDEKMPAPFGQQNNVVDGKLLALHEVDEHAVETFETDWLVIKHERHVVRCNKGIGKSQPNQPPMRRAGLQLKRRAKHRGAGALAADKRTRHMKAAFRQKFVKVVSRYAAAEYAESACAPDQNIDREYAAVRYKSHRDAPRRR